MEKEYKNDQGIGASDIEEMVQTIGESWTQTHMLKHYFHPESVEFIELKALHEEIGNRMQFIFENVSIEETKLRTKDIAEVGEERAERRQTIRFSDWSSSLELGNA